MVRQHQFGVPRVAKKEQMTTATQAHERGDVVDYPPPPFHYPEDGPYTRQLLWNAVFVIVLAAVSVMAGLPLAGISV